MLLFLYYLLLTRSLYNVLKYTKQKDTTTNSFVDIAVLFIFISY